MSIHDIPLSSVSKYILGYLATGSAVICDPPVTDTDRDYVLWVSPENAAVVKNLLVLNGFEDCARRTGDSCTSEDSIEEWDGTTPTFICRRDDLNLIVVHEERLFECWRISTKLATRFNLLNKIDRQDLFSAIRDRRLVSERVS